MDNRFKDNNYLVFNTSIANIVITEENNEIVSINFTKKNIKFSKSTLLNKAKLELKEYFNQNRKIFSFNVFPKGTPFQYLVWREIKKISYQLNLLDVVVPGLIQVQSKIFMMPRLLCLRWKIDKD